MNKLENVNIGGRIEMTNSPTVEEMQKWKKRYKLDDNGKTVIDTVDEGEYLTIHGNEAYNLCIDMNKLYEENQKLKQENEQLKNKLKFFMELNKPYGDIIKENEQLKQQIKDLRIGVLDSIHEADEIQCTCNPCVVEECVKR